MSKLKICLLVPLLAAGQLLAAPDSGATARKTAIIVENRAGKQHNDKIPVLEDLITSRIAGEGFSVLSRDVVTRALKEYPIPGETKASAEDAPGKQLDSLLENSTTVLRLAQNIGADFILIPSILSCGSEKRTYNGNGVSTVNNIYTMRIAYKLIEGGEGGAVKGGTVVSTKTLRQSDGLQIENTDLFNELLDDAAGQLAEAIIQAGKAVPTTVAKATMVNFSVACTMTDIRDQPITVPNVQVKADNRVAKTDGGIAVQPLDVTVELDGVAIGSAPGSFQARPGLHKIRLSREGFKDWERTINIFAGQKLNVALQMSDEGYARWKDNLSFLQGLENDRKLTDAEVKRIEGIAKFFSESHYRVDTKENVKIYKSLY
jgi:hypothetical protein